MQTLQCAAGAVEPALGAAAGLGRLPLGFVVFTVDLEGMKVAFANGPIKLLISLSFHFLL